MNHWLVEEAKKLVEEKEEYYRALNVIFLQFQGALESIMSTNEGSFGNRITVKEKYNNIVELYNALEKARYILNR